MAVSVLGEPVTAHADPLRTRQILGNLLTGARCGGEKVELEVAETNGNASLGLAVACQLARPMGGELEYRRSNQWTVFELSLPLVAVAAPVT